MSSTSPKKPVTNVHLLECLDLLRGDLYDLSVLIHQFIDDNAEAPNNINREKLQWTVSILLECIFVENMLTLI